MRHAEPTTQQLRAAYEALRQAAPAAWQRGFIETMESPIGARIVRARALQAIQAADLRSRAQVPLRYQRPDGQWRTRMVYGQRIDQLAISPSPEVGVISEATEP